MTVADGARSRTGHYIRGLRWWIVGMVFMLTVINYIDRMTLSVLAPTIRAEFGMSNEAYARVVTAFLIGYTISQALSGRVLDRIGTRIGFMVFVGIWTVASVLHALARSAFQLSAFRLMLGVGEEGHVASIFPESPAANAVRVRSRNARAIFMHLSLYARAQVRTRVRLSAGSNG